MRKKRKNRNKIIKISLHIRVTHAWGTNIIFRERQAGAEPLNRRCHFGSLAFRIFYGNLLRNLRKCTTWHVCPSVSWSRQGWNDFWLERYFSVMSEVIHGFCCTFINFYNNVFPVFPCEPDFVIRRYFATWLALISKCVKSEKRYL